MDTGPLVQWKSVGIDKLKSEIRNSTPIGGDQIGVGTGKGDESRFQEAAEREWKWRRGRGRGVGGYGGASKGEEGSVRRSSPDQGLPMAPFLELRIRKGTAEAGD